MGTSFLNEVLTPIVFGCTMLNDFTGDHIVKKKCVRTLFDYDYH